MRRLDDDALDPDIAAELDAIDATLAGDPVDARHAELAELALLVRAERPEPGAEFAQSLDRRVDERFARAPDAAAPQGARRWRWSLVPAIGLAAAAVVAVVIVVSSGGRGRPVVSSSGAAVSTAPTPSSSAGAAASKTAAPSRSAVHAPTAGAAARPLSPASGSVGTNPASLSPGLRLPPSNRKVVQSSQLALSTAPNRVDSVAQEVFDVVGAQNGYVSSSEVTATGGPGGYAQFQLSLPSATLAQTMTALSELRYARVASRTDNTNDITGQFSSANAQLAQAQALRTSLLGQLQNAVTQTQISSLQAQLADANTKIASAQATLRSLNHQVSYSQVSVTVQANAVAPVKHGGSGSFTIGKAAHDAGRVLTVAAGAALIALAMLVPAALLGALGWWIVSALRRRRREQALDLA